VSYLVKGSAGSSTTASTSISVGVGTNYANTAAGLISAINDSGLGLTATFATQALAGVTGGGSQTGIEISGGLISAGVDPSSASTSGTLDANGIPANQLLTLGQTVTVKVGAQTAAVVTVSPSVNTLQELADQINAATGGTAGLATAKVVTNGDGTQSLSLDVTAGGGALSVTTTGGSAAATPVFNAPTTSAPQVSLQTVSGNTAGIAANSGSFGSLTLGVAANVNGVVDSSADTVSGSIVLTDGAGAAQTFNMGGAGATATVGNVTTVQGYNLSDLAAAIQSVFVANGDAGATAVAGASGLVVTAGTLGNSITMGANTLMNTDATVGLYTPGAAGGTVYNTGLVALTGSGGTTLAGTIGAGDTLVGSVVIQDGAGAAQTFTMGGAGPTTTLGNVTTVQGNSMANLISAINGVTTAIGGASFAIAATADSSSGGMYLQSGTLGNALTITGNLSDGYAENNVTANPAGQAVVTGSNTVALLGPGSGTVNTSDLLTGSITITNAGQTHTFTMGANAYDPSSPSASGMGTNSLTVNGNTIADLARAISADTTLGLSGLASTAGLQLTSGATGATIGLGGSNTLMDTTQGTNSIVTLGPFASQNGTVSGNINFSVGGVAQTVATTQGETVQGVISQINQDTATLGVTAQWVAGANGYGSIQLTSNSIGTAGQISAATSTITDTAPTATLTYTASSAYNIGLTSDAINGIYDSTTGQNSTTAAATFVANTRSASGVATTSYSDGAGEALNGTNLLNQASAQSALAHLNRAITDVAAQDGYIGAEINTLNSISHVMSTQQENVVSAQNALQATDYASATSNMSKYEILSQTGIAALAQANSVQQEVTKLLQ
jgi:flagellin